MNATNMIQGNLALKLETSTATHFYGCSGWPLLASSFDRKPARNQAA